MEKLKFEEKNTKRIELINRHLIYFLINDDVVVYVGQTKNGLQRPFSHYDKEFNRLEVLECKEEELDMIENKYIIKYMPEYNKTMNLAYAYGLLRARNEVRKNTELKRYTQYDLKKDLIRLGIKIKSDEINGNGYITVNELHDLIEDINGELTWIMEMEI